MRREAPETEPERLLRLVRSAISHYQTTPCFEWEERAMRTARSRCCGLEPREVRRLAIQHILRGGALSARKERDEEWVGAREFDYWFSMCFFVQDVGELFVKVVLVNDEDYPEARIVGAHESNP